MKTRRRVFGISGILKILTPIALIISIGMGFLLWKHLHYPVPATWSEASAREKDGLWAKGALFRNLDDWRSEAIKANWQSLAANLVLEGTLWRNEEPVGIYYEFGKDGLFRVRPENGKLNRKIYEYSGWRYEFDPSQGYLAISNDQTMSRPNFALYNGAEKIASGSIGFDGKRLWLAMPKLNLYESRMTPASEDDYPPSADELQNETPHENRLTP